MMVDVHSGSIESLRNPNFPLDLDIHPSHSTIYQPLNLNLKEFEINYGSSAQEDAIRRYGIAGRVWEAAYAMILYLHPSSNLEFDPPIIDASSNIERISMVELGSGSGMVATAVATLLKPGRDHLIVTDLPEVCPLLETNLEPLNIRAGLQLPDGKMIIVRPLSWGSHDDAIALASEYFTGPTESSSISPLTHIICSDLVYFPELLAPLLRSLLHLTSPAFFSSTAPVSDTQGPSIFISYKIRSHAKESLFWSAFGLWFDFRPILVKDHLSDGKWTRFGSEFDDNPFVFIARRRPESYTWDISSVDNDLLGGVGASGSNSRKGDDTFENLLFMALHQD
ncbi:putative methyltransferase-domain-containing protein [Crassisporium funariophilum]|nr:putative methyltransferase-domain-containing protein [Crassisporium funariophilum]